MRRFAVIGLASLAAAASFSVAAEAQTTRERPLVLRVTPRSFLDPGTAAPVGSLNRYVTSGQMSIVTSPPYGNSERYGGSVLPDPIGGPFVGARNPFPSFPADVDATGSIR